MCEPSSAPSRLRAIRRKSAAFIVRRFPFSREYPTLDPRVGKIQPSSMRPLFPAFAVLSAIGCLVLAESGALTPKLVWSGPEVTLLGGISRDGRLLSYI